LSKYNSQIAVTPISLIIEPLQLVEAGDS